MAKKPLDILYAIFIPDHIAAAFYTLAFVWANWVVKFAALWQACYNKAQKNLKGSFMGSESKEERQRRYKGAELKTRMEMKQHQERWERRMNAPFLREISKRVFVLMLVMSLGFGVLELARMGDAGYTVAPAAALGSIVLATALPALPLLVICIVQLARIRKEKCREEASLYKVFLVVASVLLAGWGIAGLAVLVFV